MRSWFLAAVSASAGLCLASSEGLTRRGTYNCSTLQLVIARGTGEPGTYGAVIGDPLLNATAQLWPNTTAYAVPYPASVECDSEAIGISETLAYLNASSAACPNMKYALVGYSQGADIMHHVGIMLDESMYASVVALTLFGDPNNRGVGQYDPVYGTPDNVTTGVLPSTLAARLKENCNVGDPVCTNNGTDYLAHVEYNAGNNTFIKDTAAYITKQLYLIGSAGPDDSQAAAPGDQTEANVQAVLALGAAFGASGVTTCVSATSSSLPTASTIISGHIPTTSGSAATTTPTASNTGSSTSAAESSGTSSASVATQTTSAGVPRIAPVLMCQWALMIMPVALLIFML